MVGLGFVTVSIHFGSRYQKTPPQTSLTRNKLQKTAKTSQYLPRLAAYFKKQTKFCISTSTAAMPAHLLLVENVIFKGVKRG